MQKLTNPAVPSLVLESGNYSLVEGEDRKLTLKRIRNLDSVEHSNARSTVIRRFELPFYDDVNLLELRNQKWINPNVRLCFLEEGDKLYWLNGTSPPIHEVNENSYIWISESNVLQYLAFFCFFVRGEEGPFYIIDKLNSGFIPKVKDLNTLNNLFRSPELFGQDHNGDWRISALVYYSNAIFFADFLVGLDGMIEMIEDEPIAADLDHKVDAPLSGTDKLK